MSDQHSTNSSRIPLFLEASSRLLYIYRKRVLANLQFACNAGPDSPSAADAADSQPPKDSITADKTAADPSDPVSIANGHPTFPPTSSEDGPVTAYDISHSPDQQAAALGEKAPGNDDNTVVTLDKHVVGEELDARALTGLQQQNDGTPAAPHADAEQQSRHQVSSMHVVGEELDTKASDHHQQRQQQQQQHDKLSLPHADADRQSNQAAVEHVIGDEQDSRSTGSDGRQLIPCQAPEGPQTAHKSPGNHHTALQTSQDGFVHLLELL